MQKEEESTKALLSFLQPGRGSHLNERVLQLQPHHKLQVLWQICIQEMLWMNTLGTGGGVGGG